MAYKFENGVIRYVKETKEAKQPKEADKQKEEKKGLVDRIFKK